MSTIKFTIPEPCHENWQNMTVAEQGRFCLACQKEVIDFSNLSDSEAYHIILKSNADSCGRFSAEQMSSGIRYETEKRQYWHRYFFSFLVPAFLLTKQSAAQVGKIIPQANSRHHKAMEKMVLPCQDRSFELSGTVVDSSSNEKIGFATVTVKNTGTGIAVNDEGNFTLKSRIKSTTVTLRITAIGYESKEIEIVVPEANFVLAPEIFYLKKQVIDLEAVAVRSAATEYKSFIVGGFISSVKVSRWHNLQKIIITAVTDSIRIFPNPVTRGNDFKISLKLPQAGNHTIQVIAMDGSVLLQQSFIASSKTYTGEINCASTWAAGIYNLRVIGQGNRLIGVTRFVVN